MTAPICRDCKFSSQETLTKSCVRDSEVDLVDGTLYGKKYKCAEERGYDVYYLRRAIAIGHEVCGVEGKFFEAK